MTPFMFDEMKRIHSNLSVVRSEDELIEGSLSRIFVWLNEDNVITKIF